MTVLHAGGKFDHSSYKVSAGLHGVGVSAVNAVSEWLKAGDQARGPRLFPGVPSRRSRRRRSRSSATPTRRARRSRSSPIREIFTITEFSYDILASRLRELSFLNAGFVITLTDERGEGRKETFEYKGGIREFVEHLNKTKEPVHDKVVHIIAEVPAETDTPVASVEVALQWNSTYAEQIFPYTNNIHNKDGGTHLTGFKARAHARLQHLRNEREPLQGGEERPLRRGHPRRAHRRHQREAPGSVVLLADEGQARLERGEGRRRDGRERQARHVLRGEPADRPQDRREDDHGREGPRGRAQGARGRAQGRDGLHEPLRQARRLPVEGPGDERALHRRGRLRRWLREAGPRPQDPGDPPAQGEDPQRRARASRQDARRPPRSARSSPRSAAASAAPSRAAASTSRSSATTRSC